MALMKCPECGNQISDKARVCIHCGYPLSEVITSGAVRIKMPDNIVEGWAGLVSPRRAIVYANDRILWEGKHGENAIFTISAPTKVTIELGSWATTVEGIVYPRRKNALIQASGMYKPAIYRLAEVDVIDTD